MKVKYSMQKPMNTWVKWRKSSKNAELNIGQKLKVATKLLNSYNCMHEKRNPKQHTKHSKKNKWIKLLQKCKITQNIVNIPLLTKNSVQTQTLKKSIKNTKNNTNTSNKT